MEASAPEIFRSLEASALGAAIREAVWAYPAANVGHVLAVLVFFAAVAVMDVRLLGAFPRAPPDEVLRGARRFAVAAFAVVALTGAVLFTAEASHLALNPVFQTKALLIALALVNVVGFDLLFRHKLAQFPSHMPLPALVRASAFLSLAFWLAVAACGRSIAYF